jgi:predicted SAM-dependent methyltransferase
MKRLNLGCGNRLLPGWTNVDFVSRSPSVQQHDLSKGIPFADNTFDLVYHSHVLEHFSKGQGLTFIEECYRVLVPGGYIRVVVPDLEMIAKLYLLNLAAVTEHADELSLAEYQWSTIELIDQMVRANPGGEMLLWWSQDKIINEDTVRKRMGHEFTSFRSQLEAARRQTSGENEKRHALKSRIKTLIKRALRPEPKSIDFRRSGEVHQWMYDRFSLKILLERCGFKSVLRVDEHTTLIKGWEEFRELDQEAGEIRKPDSLFMEGMKPGGREVNHGA